MKTTTFQAMEFSSPRRALQYAEASGGEAILLAGRNLVVAFTTADRLAAAGVAFACLAEHDRPAGDAVVVTIPVN